eukprot:9639396-Ditylum_brightwellii.AAC.1
MSCQPNSKTKTQQSTHIIAVGTLQQPAQQHQQQINDAVPPPNAQNEGDGMSPSVWEYMPDRSWWTNIDNKDGK